MRGKAKEAIEAAVNKAKTSISCTLISHGEALMLQKYNILSSYLRNVGSTALLAFKKMGVDSNYLTPRNFYYWQRSDILITWITKSEEIVSRSSTFSTSSSKK